MSYYTHQTAPTQFVEANGIRFAYRRFGKTGGVPLVFNQHYIGDPSLLAGLPNLARVAAWGGGFPIKVGGEVVGGDRAERSAHGAE
jgi:hypothetical protein